MPPSPLASAGSAASIQQPSAATALAPALLPRAAERLQRVKGDLRMGLPVLLRDGGDTILLAAVEMLTEQRYGAMTALGQPELALTRRRAEALGTRPLLPAEALRLRVPPGAGLCWLAGLAGQAGQGAPADTAGLPILQAATPLQLAAIGIARAAQIVPAILSVALDAGTAATVAGAGLAEMPLTLAVEALGADRAHRPVSSAQLPMTASEAGRVHVFRPDDAGLEHYAIEIGTPDRRGPVTVRMHSACFTGDVLGSLKCDCGPQLRAAMAAMAEGGGGVLLYLNQEGRGIGLANKMRAYALQDAGLDTVEANHWLGFEDDQRDFRIGAQILRSLGIGRVRLMTNNPAKVAILSGQGIEVAARVPLRVGRTAQNAHYLATKAAKSGHLL